MRTSSGSSLGEVRNNWQCGLALKKKLKPNIWDKISFIINRTGPIRNDNDDTKLATLAAICTQNPYGFIILEVRLEGTGR